MRLINQFPWHVICHLSSDSDILHMVHIHFGAMLFVGPVALTEKFRALANQNRGRGREESGWVATVALVRTKRHSRGSPGDKNPSNENQQQQQTNPSKIKNNLPVESSHGNKGDALSIFEIYRFFQAVFKCT